MTNNTKSLTQDDYAAIAQAANERARGNWMTIWQATDGVIHWTEDTSPASGMVNIACGVGHDTQSVEDTVLRAEMGGGE